MNIVELPIKSIFPYKNNPRHNDKAVEFVANSLRQFGWKQPIVIDENYEIVCGHTRWKAAKMLGMETVPCVMADDLTPEQVQAYRLADNKTAEMADWDFDLLEQELNDIDPAMFDMADFGFFQDDEETEDKVPTEVTEDDFDETAVTEAVCKRGQIWQLGNHRLICGDSTDVNVIDRLMDGVKADMVFTDPPYGMKKENEGVLNDNLNFDDLLDFNRQWIPLTFGALKDNGSWYCWGIDEPLMDIYSNILKPMIKENKVTFRNLITWKKENDNPTMLFNGACSSNKRSYYTNEKCLFVMSGVQGFNNNSDNYYEAWEPIRTYLKQERDRMGWSNADMKKMCGHSPTSGCHWFDKSQWMMPTEEEYKTWQHHAKGEGFKKEYEGFKKEYEEIKKEYDAIKKDWYETRAYFDGTNEQCVDVWVHNVTSNKEREHTGGHATPKPIALCSRAIKSSSREGEIVLDVFGGSGSTLIACEQLNRKCYMCELDPHYCDVILKRWEDFTGQEAVLLEE